MVRNLVKLMLVVFLLVPNGVAVYLFREAATESRVAELVDQSQSGYSKTEPFAAEGRLRSPSGQTIKSMHFQETCLGYRIKFDLRHTVVDSEGEEEDRRVLLFEERHQVPDLEAVFGEEKAILDLQALQTFYHAKYAELDELPEYVPYERIPKIQTDRFWFEVYEAIFSEAQPVTVVGKVNAVGVLEAHPVAGSLIVFPGSRAECAQALDDSSRTYQIIAGVLIGVSILASLLLGLILKFVKD
jgi:hypothetical protein